MGKTGRHKRISYLPIVLSIGVPLFILSAAGVYLLSLQKIAVSVDDRPEVAMPNDQQEDLELKYAESDAALWARLWAREEPGHPISLPYAPAGVQTIVRLRLAALLAHPEGRKIIRSLGPTLETALSSWLQRIGTAGETLEELNLYLLPQGTTLPQVVAVGMLRTGTTHESLAAFTSKNERQISKLATDSIWFPPDNLQGFVFGPTEVVEKLANNSEGANTYLLRRELEELRLASHHTDHLTVLTNPNFLRDEAQGLFPNTRRRLLEGLYDFWSEEAQAIYLGFQLSDVAIAEVRMIAREDLPPRRFAAMVKDWLAALPTKTSDFLGRVELDPYWQPLALRFPAMVRFAKEQTRIVAEGKQVAITTALPAEGVHNLLLAAELSLASSVRTSTSNETMDRSTWTIGDVLKSKISVTFAQKSLELATRDLGEQVRDELSGLPFEFIIEIVGTDLEPEGITRNQQIRDFREKDRPVADVLTSLVLQANPVQAVATASESNQKLVWVVSTDEVGKVLITTRAAAQAKNLTLPAVFQP